MRNQQQSDGFWNDHLDAWKQSGQSQAAYCDEQNLSFNQLVYQKSKRDGKRRSKSAPAAASAFASLALVPATRADLTIRFLCGTELTGIDAGNFNFAKQLIELLK